MFKYDLDIHEYLLIDKQEIYYKHVRMMWVNRYIKVFIHGIIYMYITITELSLNKLSS